MKEIAVIGGGVMGCGIAQVLAQSEAQKVKFFDYFRRYCHLESARERVLLGFAQARNTEKKFVYRSRVAIKKILEKIEWHDLGNPNDLENLKTCQAAIEAMKESLDEKKAIYKLLEAYLPKDAFIFSNSSTLRIGAQTEGMENPKRLIGLHFFNPVPVMPSVEIILQKESMFDHDFDAEKVALRIAHALGKKPFWAPDLPGFIANRLFVKEVEAALEEKAKGADFKKIDKAFTTGAWFSDPVARRIVDKFLNAARGLIVKDKAHETLRMPEKTFQAHVDELMKLGGAMPMGPYELIGFVDRGEDPKMRFRMGPFAFTDHVGLDVALGCCKMLKLQEPDCWEIPEVLESMVKKGRLGKKPGEGFYKYSEEVKVEIAPDKSYARVSWTGKTLPLYIIKKLRERFAFLESFGVKKVFLEINRCRGADIGEFLGALADEENAKRSIGEWHLTIQKIISYPGSVIALVSGSAIGGGYELALACGYIVAVERGVDVEKRILELVSKNIPKRARNPIDLSLRLKERLKHWQIDELFNSISYRWMINQEIQKTREYWKDNPPASFDLAAKAILDDNQKSFDLGLIEEFHNITAAFGTNDAQERVRRFLEGERFIEKDKEMGVRVGLSEMTLGIMPGGGGTQTLTRRVGSMLALWMILRGAVVKAEPPWVDEVIN